MNLQTTTQAMFETGVAKAIPELSALPSLPERVGKGKGRATNPAGMPELSPEMEIVEDAGLGAMAGLGVAMMFNAGLALAGLVGWEIWTMLH